MYMFPRQKHSFSFKIVNPKDDCDCTHFLPPPQTIESVYLEFDQVTAQKILFKNKALLFPFLLTS